MSEKRFMKKMYYTLSHPGSFGGFDRLHRAIQDETGKKVNVQRVKDFLSEQDSYTLHKPARIHFGRNRVFVPCLLNQFQADLCDIQALAEHNDEIIEIIIYYRSSMYFQKATIMGIIKV